MDYICGCSLQGFVTTDRRTKQRIEADEKLAQLLAEHDIGEDQSSQEPSGEQPKLILGGITKDDRELQIVVKTAKVLVANNQPAQAVELLGDCITGLMRRCIEK